MKRIFKKRKTFADEKIFLCLSTIQTAALLIGLSIFVLGRISNFLMVVGLFLSITNGILAGITLMNIHDRKITTRVLEANMIIGILFADRICYYLEVVLFSEDYFALMLGGLILCFSCLVMILIISVFFYVAIYK